MSAVNSNRPPNDPGGDIADRIDIITDIANGIIKGNGYQNNQANQAYFENYLYGAKAIMASRHPVISSGVSGSAAYMVVASPGGKETISV